MIALNTPITLPALRHILEKGWNWWTGELLEALPIGIRRRIIPFSSEFIIDLAYTEAIISQVGENQSNCPIQIALSESHSQARIDEARQLLEAAPLPKVRVCIPLSMALQRELELPKSAESRLREIVGLDLDRQTPLTLENAAYDVVVLERNHQTGRIRVGLALIKNETIETVLTLCRELGVYPASIAIAGKAEFNFLPASQRRVGNLNWKRPWIFAAVGIGLLFLLNIGLGYKRLDSRIAQLNTELAKARQDAQGTEKLRAQLARSRSEAQLLSKANAQPNALDMLQELTHIMPDEVWLFQFELKNGSVQIAGFAPAASDIIERLNKTALFTNPRFKAAVMHPENSNEERFEIDADLAPQEVK